MTNEEALKAFEDRLLAAQRDLPSDAAQVLRDHLWELYEDEAVTASSALTGPQP